MLARYAWLLSGSPKESPNGVDFVIDLGALPDHGDGPSAELMVIRDLERAISLHTVT